MKEGYLISHGCITEEDSILEVVNWDQLNQISFYAWGSIEETIILKETIGIWKQKTKKL